MNKTNNYGRCEETDEEKACGGAVHDASQGEEDAGRVRREVPRGSSGPEDDDVAIRVKVELMGGDVMEFRMDVGEDVEAVRTKLFERLQRDDIDIMDLVLFLRNKPRWLESLQRESDEDDEEHHYDHSDPGERQEIRVKIN